MRCRNDGDDDVERPDCGLYALEDYVQNWAQPVGAEQDHLDKDHYYRKDSESKVDRGAGTVRSCQHNVLQVEANEVLGVLNCIVKVIEVFTIH